MPSFTTSEDEENSEREEEKEENIGNIKQQEIN